ncbi:MAG: M28 family peptidase [Armatimonadota bacterium]|nr:M28 family peptidase [Armatimonadota bacterium]
MPVPSNVKVGFDAIKPADARTWLNYLAGPNCMGRGTGQPGYQKAAEYVAARFKEFGLKPIGDNGTYFQNVIFTKVALDEKKSSLTLSTTDQAFFPTNGFAVDSLSGDVEIDGPVVFVRTNSKEATTQDPAVFADKIIVLTAVDETALATQISKARPKAILTVVPGDNVESAGRISRGQGGGPGRAPRTVRARITRALAAQLAGATKVDSKMTLTSGNTAVDVVESGATARFSLRSLSEEIKVPNVVAALEGSDPVLKNEVVGLGSHLDHMGESNGQVYWGADDDASGSTALILTAKAFTSNPVKPKRTIVFMAFCGEEMGLIGSGHYANNPIFPLKDMVCELQMDMVGRNEEKEGETPLENVDTIHLVGSQRLSTQLHELCLAQNRYLGFKFEYDEEDVYTRSDHYQFASKGVPIAFLFSGFHPDYHQPTDTADKINFDKIVNAAKLFFLVAHEAATKPRLVVDKAGG